MLVLIVWPCTLAVSHTALMSHGEYAEGTDRQTDMVQTDGRQTVTLRFPLDGNNNNNIHIFTLMPDCN